MTAMASLALVAWISDPGTRQAARARIEESGVFDVLDLCPDRSGFVRAVAEHNPDVVLVDTEAGHDECFERLMHEVGRGGPPTSIVVVPGDYQPSEVDRLRAKSLKTTTLSRTLLTRDDGDARENVISRLQALASRVAVRHRRTLGSDDLQTAMNAVIEASNRREMNPRIAKLAAWPVDLVLMLGDPVAINELRTVLDGVFHAVMPVVICIRGMTAEETAAALADTAGVKPEPLGRRGSLRELRGYFTAGWGEFTLQGERYSSGPDASGPQSSHPLLQACGLASGLMVIELSRTLQPGEAHARALKSGCVITALHPADCAEPEVANSLKERGLANALFRTSELQWYLSNVVPRRG